MANNFCPNCGKLLKPNANFCGYCGEKIINNKDVSSIKLKKFSIKVKIMVLFLITAMVGYVAYYNFSPERQVINATNTFMDEFLTLATADSNNITENHIDRVVNLMDSSSQKQAKLIFTQYVAGVYSGKKKPNYKVLNVEINNNTAIAKIKIEEKPDTYNPPLSTVYLKKIHDTWYIDDFE